MAGSNIVLVKMAEIQVVDDGRTLKTTLGSCVGVILHDSGRPVGGLAHIMLPVRVRADEALGKYADTAVPELLERVLQGGGRRRHLRAYLAGGANMFRWSSDSRIATIGEKNIDATRSVLAGLGIPIEFEDVGGEQGRTVVFDSSSGEIRVHTLARIVWKGDTK